MKKLIGFLFAAMMCAGCAYIPIGRYGFGIEKTPKREGIIVHTVKEDSPAERAGIQKNDVIVSLDGKRVENPYVVAKGIAEKPYGTKVLLKIIREGKPLNVELLIEKKVLQILNADVTGVYPDYSLMLVEDYFWLGSYPYPMTPEELENLRNYLLVYDLDHLPAAPFTIFTLRVR